MPYGIIAGTTTIGTLPCGNVHRLGRFLANADALVDELRFYSLQNAILKINFYADDAGEPGALLFAVDSGQFASPDQWNAYAVSPGLPLLEGEYYWIGANANSGGGISYSDNTSDTRIKTALWGTFSAPDPAGIGYDTHLDQLFGAAIYGLPNPVVTSISGDDIFFDHDENVAIVVTDAGAVEGVVELCDTADYDLAVHKVVQPVDSWSDTAIQIDIEPADLPAGGVYLFITTGAGQRNRIGHAATMNIEFIGTQLSAATVPNGFWPYNGVYANAGISGGVVNAGIRAVGEEYATFWYTGGATRTFTIRGTNGAVVNVDWGDGSAIEPFTLLGASTNVNCAHAYVAGDYRVKIYGSLTDITYLNGNSESSLYGDVAGLAPLVSLITLDWRNTSVSGDIVGIAPLTSLVSLYLQNTSVSGDVVGLAPLTSITALRLFNTGIYYSLGALPAWNGADIRTYDCAMTQEEVDAQFTDHDNAVMTGGAISSAGSNAAPSAGVVAGAIANLVGRGVVCTYN